MVAPTPPVRNCLFRSHEFRPIRSPVTEGGVVGFLPHCSWFLHCVVAMYSLPTSMNSSCCSTSYTSVVTPYQCHHFIWNGQRGLKVLSFKQLNLLSLFWCSKMICVASSMAVLPSFACFMSTVDKYPTSSSTLVVYPYLGLSKRAKVAKAKIERRQFFLGSIVSTKLWRWP